MHKLKDAQVKRCLILQHTANSAWHAIQFSLNKTSKLPRERENIKFDTLDMKVLEGIHNVESTFEEAINFWSCVPKGGRDGARIEGKNIWLDLVKICQHFSIWHRRTLAGAWPLWWIQEMHRTSSPCFHGPKHIFHSPSAPRSNLPSTPLNTSLQRSLLHF